MDDLIDDLNSGQHVWVHQQGTWVGATILYGLGNNCYEIRFVARVQRFSTGSYGRRFIRTEKEHARALLMT